MKLFMLIFLLQNQYYFFIGSFIESYIDPQIVKKCSEIQKKFIVKHAFRALKEYNINSHVVYLFTENEVYAIPQLTAALFRSEPSKVVLREIFFNKVSVKPLDEFWNRLKPENENYNTVFADWHTHNTAFWVFGDKYRPVNISIDELKVKLVNDPIQFSQSKFGFMHNQKIKENGFQNILAVDFAQTNDRKAPFQPIRVYVRDNNVRNNNNTISFAFYNYTETDEEFENGKHYPYSFDSAAYLSPGRSYAGLQTIHHINHYFEMRTRKGSFSLFDFYYNTDNLLIGSTEELLGCPPSFCQTHRFDDIIRLHDGKKLLVYREWVWNFTKPGDIIVYEEAVIANLSSRKHEKTNFKTPFQFAIRHIVDGSFTHNGILYIFRNGSFIESNDDTILEKQMPFKNYTEIGSFFIGIPTQFYDTLFYHKESKIVYFILDDKYWAYSMADKKLVSDDYPKHIKALGLPHSIRIKATYVDEDNSGNQIKFYFFTQTNYIYYDSSQFKNGKFERQPLVYYCTSTNFLGCPQNDQFHCPPEPIDEDESSETSSSIVLLLIIVIVILIVIIVMIALIIIISKKVKQKSEKIEKDVKQEKSSNAKMPLETSPSALSMRSVNIGGKKSKTTKK